MRLLAIFMCLAMLATVTPIFASADDAVSYLGIDESTGKAEQEYFVAVDNVIDDANDSFVTGWNIVKGNVEFENRIVLPGDVNLILENGATLTAKRGIVVAESGDFAVYAQSTNPDVMGKLVVPEGVIEYSAGIGSTEGKICGNIAIYGGNLSVRGGGKGAAIGSAASAGGCGNITISGGIVDAVSTGDGAGIGSGREASCGTVTITGGYVRAECGEGAAPIGAGYLSDAVSVSISTSCMSMTMGNVRYINYAPIARTEPTCTKSGFESYCLDLVSKNYYEAFPFTEEGLIGNGSALTAWQAEGGAGYIAPLGHEWQYGDVDNHKCTRCDATELHTDVDKNNLCDVCGATVVPYLGYNEETEKADKNCAAAVGNVIDDAADLFVTGWNVVEGDVEFESRIELPKDVKLILADGATLTADKGIMVAEDGDFAVYAQSTNSDVMGALVVPDSMDEYDAGIGSGNGNDCSSIAIYGGVVTVNGGYGAAGIGSGFFEASCGSITISGGIVTAKGGFAAAGIGTGFNSSCGDITISDGQVIAQGKESGAGIGVGKGMDAVCGKVSITGGFIKAGTEPDDNYIEASQVSIDSSFEKCYMADALYINCIPVEETEADCTNIGALAYFKDAVNGLYYTDFPFTEGGLIGDADALAAWKAEGGAGHKANPLGHDWQYQDGAKHICRRCKTTQSHVDENEDHLCDMCGATATPYLDYNETTGQADLSRTVWVNNIITDGTTDSFVSGWNMVKGNVTFENRIVLPKDVNLILADGATLNAVKGITVAEDGDFAVYAQSTDSAVMGKLIVPEGVDEHSAGIGAIYSKNCGNISIYGGRVTANAGYGAAGIGSGYTGNCASVSVYGGYVVAKGGYGAAGVGSGWAAASSCYKVTIAGGHIKATAGTLADGIEAEEVSMDDSFVVLKEGSSSYANCKVPMAEPTCTDSGFSEYFVDPVSCYYYSAFPFAEGGIIGGNTALAIWKAKNGDGYIAPLGHDWQYYDHANHVCQRCEATESHMDEDEDSLCDACGAKHTIYLDYNEVSKEVDLPTNVWANRVAVGASSFVSGWNIVEGNVTFENRIVLPKDVNLILADGATLTAKKGITVAEDGGFAVYAQSTDKDTMGKLIVPEGVADNYPGIGSSDKADCADVAIHGGVVTVTGGVGGAGIGSGYGSGFTCSCGNIIIDGGLVTANGGYGAAGVGSGDQGDCGKVMISGGMVTASSGYGAAGIGSGFLSSCEGVVISGGLVIAQGGERAAGIGGGYATSCGRVTIASGNIKATAGGSYADPIGSGELADPDVDVDMPSTCISTITGNVQYVNCELFPETEADCTTTGALAYFRDSVKGLYYTEFPFTPEVLIGDEDALSAWKGEGGAGHKGNAWGHNWAYVAGNTHKCARCNLVENHTDEDKDGMCDVCRVPLTMHLGYNETTGKADRVYYAYVEHVIDEATDSFASGWNIVKGNVTFDDRIRLPGEVHLILEDGATLTAKKGITVASFGDFSIYAQSADESTMGKLIVPDGVGVNNAGIGPVEGGICSNISIYGGAITAYGGEHGAGIGGAYGDLDHTCGNITIYGGVVNAYGGKSASGIGVGKTATCRKVIIKGGVVNAYGGENGAGIGGASYGIEISGGSILAVGGDYSAGIGSGYGTGYCDGVDITGGYIKAIAGNTDAEPIGEAALSGAVLVTIDPSCTSVIKGRVEQYINCELVDAIEPTCTTNGTVAYIKDCITGSCYTSFPFTEDGFLCDAAGFAAWTAEGGGGYVSPLGHDWQYVDGSTHKCARCEHMEDHLDEDKDFVCDLCKEVIPVYLDYDMTTGRVETESLLSDVTILDDATDSFATGWNIVKGNVVFEDRIVLPEDVNLILANGATLTAKKGITVSETGTFSVYAQSNNPAVAGKLVVPENGAAGFNAGIGSEDSGTCGDIAIYGGNITSYGGASSAGIGSGYAGACGDITIYGGFVTTQGGAAIGSGVNGTCKTIRFSDGIVFAQGVYSGAAIGTGLGTNASCEAVSITGGYIKATTEEGSEPIGAGYNAGHVEVSVDEDTCTYILYGTVAYINYEFHEAVEPTCANAGSLAYYCDYVSGNYYTEFPFTEDGLIGNGEVFDTWKNEGDGYLPLLPHTDANEDGICDVCEITLPTYLDYNASTGKVDAKRIVLDQFNVIDDANDAFVTGWNIVKGNVTFDSRIVLPKDVDLILADGAELTADNGISVATDGDLSIYAQSDDPDTMGKITIPDDVTSHRAGIGTDKNRDCGKISVYGGNLHVHGGYRSAAIGAGSDASCAGVEIFGGNVEAIGGEDAAGIGCGRGISSCNHITICGGNVTAQGSMYGAGIGSSYEGSCGNITISGGFVTAIGGHDFGAGIGSGFNASCDGVSITGGYIQATPGVNAQPIGAGWKTTVEVSVDSSCTSKTIDGVRYINFEPVAEVAPTCAAIGTRAYFIDNVSSGYYASFPFTEDNLIGNDAALALWKAEGGDGYLPKVSHHTDENDDGTCDVCEETLPKYLNFNESTGKMDKTYTLLDQFNVIDDADDAFVTGWNVVEGNVEFISRIDLPADVNLILTDGATLTADEGITVSKDGSFAIFAQSVDPDTMGKLIVPSGGVFKFFAGIGSEDGGTCGSIVIYGGSVTSYGGVAAAGIGAGDQGECGDILIFGGIVTAKGEHCSTGIGSGAHSSSCGNISIYDGIVEAASGSDGAGIGSGSNSSCGNISIFGGIVNAASTGDGAGIGAGLEASCGKVSITGGYIKAVTGNENAQPIGAGVDSEAVEVSISELTCTSVTKGNTQYVNYEEIEGVEPTCTTGGTLGYCVDYISGNYYASLPFADDSLIGDADALGVWLSEDGDGYLTTVPHPDENEDEICDVCGAVHAPYLDFNETTGKVDTECDLWGANLIDDADDAFVSGWNVVKGSVEFEDRLELPANVKLILADGATLTAKKGISLAVDGEFAVYAHSNDAGTMGKLIVPAGLTENMAGIGTPYEGNCGNLAIYGGMVTVQGGYHAAAIGSGLRNACGNITIRGGVVTALAGASAAGIGSGFGAACGKVTITGGYIKAVAGEDAEPIGSGYFSDNITEVSIDSSCTSVIKGNTQYINYEEIAKVDATCTTKGTLAYVKDSVSGNFYTSFPFTEDNLIGDADALATWKAQGGGGYVAPLGHDWQYVNETIHECSRCKATEAHTGTEDYICDVCEGVLLETAKEDAATALSAAVGEKPSTEVASLLSDALDAVDKADSLTDVSDTKAEWLEKIEAQLAAEALAAAKAEAVSALTEAASVNTSDDMTSILDDAKTAVNEATTLDDVALAKASGLAAIGEYLEELSEEKEAAKTALADAAGEKPSTEMTALLSDAFDAIEATDNLSDVSDVKAEWLDKIKAQLAAEALAAAKAEAVAALTEAASVNTSDDMTTILDDAKTAVNEATTLDGVALAKTTGLAAINAYLEDLSEAKTAAKTALADAAGEKPSTEVGELLSDALDAIEAADNLSDVSGVKAEWLDKIKAQLAAEALAAAKAEAISALTQAASVNTSDDMTAILDDAKTAVNEATTLDDVALAKTTGLAAINTYLEDLSEAKVAAKTALADAAGENPSTEVAELLSDALDAVDKADTLSDVSDAKEEWLDKIKTQLAAEALAAAKAEAISALTEAASVNTSDDMTAILDDAKTAVNEATTLNDVALAKSTGLAAIGEYLEELSEAKADAKTAFTDAAGENPSTDVMQIVDSAKETVDACEGVAAVAAAKEAGLAAIAAQLQKEADAKALAGAKKEAKDALTKAAGDTPSDALSEILKEALEAVEKSETIEAVGEAKEAGLSAISEQLIAEGNEKALAIAKEAANTALDNAAGENPSEELSGIVAAAKDAVNACENVDAVTAAKEAGLSAIAAQLQKEANEKALADAKKEAKDALNQAAGDTPSDALSEILKNAVDAVEKSDTIEAVGEAKEAGLAAIAKQLIAEGNEQALAIAKEAASAAFDNAAGENPSEELSAIVAAAKDAVNACENVDAVTAAKEAGLAAIAKQLEKEKEPSVDVLLGDANGDGAVDMKDVLLLRKFLAGLSDEMEKANADVNEDGSIDMKDVLMIRKFLANLIEKLGA